MPKVALRQEYLELEGQLWELDRRLAAALNRIKHAPSDADLEQARQDEKAVFVQLDRLMTIMRAIESQLLQLAKKERPH